MAPLWIILLLQTCLLSGVFCQLAEVILSPDCGSGPDFPCTVVPVTDSKGNYIYDYQQEDCDQFDCLAVNVVSDPTWFCNSVLSAAGGGFKARVEIGVGIGVLPVGKKEDNFASCQYSRVLDLLSLGNCRDVTLHTCTDCSVAYKRWICSMQFPKCIPYPFHMSTRKNFTAGIKNTIWGYGGTDPNYALPPCFELCYDVMRKCPPSLQFTCPTDTRNYGHPPDCNNFNIPGF